jgi:hypothetical protein
LGIRPEVAVIDPAIAVSIEWPEPIGYPRRHLAGPDVAVAVEVVALDDALSRGIAMVRLAASFHREPAGDSPERTDRSSLLATVEMTIMVPVEPLQQHLTDLRTFGARARAIGRSDSTQRADRRDNRRENQAGELHACSTRLRGEG